MVQSRINKTLTVDPFKMELFEKTKKQHGVNISDILDEKLEEFLIKVSPVEMQRKRVEDLRAELREETRVLKDLEHISEKWEQEQEKKAQKEEIKQSEEDKKISNRLKRYEERKQDIASLLNSGFSPAWKDLANEFGFYLISELKDWLGNKLQEDNLLKKGAWK